VRLVFSGAAPLGEDMARELSRKLNCPVVQGYGMTEASPVTHLSPTKNAPMKPGSAGRVIPNTEVKIVYVGTGEGTAPGKEGELWIRGPQIMQGYLNQPEETAACLDREGWYHTGDVGFVDGDGWRCIRRPYQRADQVQRGCRWLRRAGSAARDASGRARRCRRAQRATRRQVRCPRRSSS
jgi:long-subunit acyl-CoA synthetase (AMP-forming)